jgi:hypothetical protein
VGDGDVDLLADAILLFLGNVLLRDARMRRLAALR